MKARVWYTSKTLWFNAITFTLGILAMTEFNDIAPANWAKYLLMITAVGNLILRQFFTNGPSTGTKSEAQWINNYVR